jgi:hypothetical protein
MVALHDRAEAEGGNAKPNKFRKCRQDRNLLKLRWFSAAGHEDADVRRGVLLHAKTTVAPQNPF